MPIPPRTNPLLAETVRSVRPDGFFAPPVFREEKTLDKRQLLKLFREQSASEFIGTITPGFHIFGLTKGQFSLVDVVREVSNRVGPCDLALSTWTIGKIEGAELEKLSKENRFSSVRILLDFTFQSRQPNVNAQVRKVFGARAIVVTRNHCKFALFSNDRWKIVCRTSMNLNYNPRLEDLDIKDDPALYSFFMAILDEIFASNENRRQATKEERAAAFAALGG